jgi:tetratricopeptide (TPR) repeat protein
LTGLVIYPKRKLRKLLKLGEYKKAIEFGKSIEKKYGNDPDYNFIMGSIFYSLDDAKNALDYFDRVLAINPKDIETLLLKGNIYLFLKDTEQSLAYCNKILDIDSNNIDAERLLERLHHTYDDNSTNEKTSSGDSSTIDHDDNVERSI